MFERFTERSRQVVVLAQEEARTLKHDYIGTEHLLLGLLRMEEGLAARVLTSLGVSVDEVRTRVVEDVGEGDEARSGQIPFTPRAKKVLELALREALSLGHNYIGTEHILLGLVREDKGVAATVLLDLGLDTEMIRNQVIRALPPTPRREGDPRHAAWMRPPGRRPRRRWEFRVERWQAAEPEARQALLDELGADGWQLAAVVPDEDAAQWVFQRPARPGPPKPDPDAA